MTKKVISARLSPENVEWVKEQARLKDRSYSHVIDQAVERARIEQAIRDVKPRPEYFPF